MKKEKIDSSKIDFSESPGSEESILENMGSAKYLQRKYKEGSLREIYLDWKWSWKYTYKYRFAVFFYIIAGILSSTMALVTSVLMKKAIDIITGYKVEQLPFLVVSMIVSLLASMILNSVVSRISAKISLLVYNDLQAEVFDSVMNSDWMLLQTFSNGDLVNRFNNDVSVVANNSISWLPNMVIAIYQLAATFFVIFHYSRVMALIALTSAPLMLLCSRKMISKQREYNLKTKELTSELMTFELETFYNIDMIKAFGITDFFADKLNQWQDRYKKLALKYNWFNILTSLVMTAMNSIIQFMAFGYCLFLLWSHAITFGTMTLFLQQRSRLTSAFNQAAALFPNILSASVSARRIRDLCDLEPESRENSQPGYLKEAYSVKISQIKFKQVCFNYADDQNIYSKANFSIEKGDIAAFSGPSGKGKTTLIRLILALIHPQSGSIQIIDNEGNVLDRAHIRKSISYVPQGNVLISGTIADNLRLVKPNANDQELEEALKQACAWEFVQRLPKKLYTDLKEHGNGLSQGQGQRIAIARALLRNSSVLILDEATSALDEETEDRVINNIMADNSERIIIITTHKKRLLHRCNKIFYINNGQIQYNEQYDYRT